MSATDAHLYTQDRPASRTKTKEISSAGSLAFSSALSSLIKASASPASSSQTTAGRARGSSKKDDIFTSHNRNVKKRAAKDLEDVEDARFAQKHRGRTGEEKDADAEGWRRAKRRMEEKARLYDALKRGDVEDLDDKYGVDFDRKWAEQQQGKAGAEGAAGESSSSSDDESEAEQQELIEYVDEFGRTRQGTRAEIAREQRRQRTLAADEPDRFTARPSMPDAIIYGDAVQASAFNPSETIAEQMAALAAKRDKSLTPPPDVHFDGRAEVRQRGTGFMYFSKDEEERQAQMDGLERERRETERVRQERREEVERRRELLREKKQKMMEKRRQGEASRFLDDLGSELFKGKDDEAVGDSSEAAKDAV